MEEDRKPTGKRYRTMDTISHVFTESEVNHRLFGNEGFQFFLLQKKWETIVGQVMAHESYISSYKGDTLFVTVTNSVFMQQLYMMQGEIMKQLAEDDFGKRFQQIRFITGPRKKRYKTQTSLDVVNQQRAKEQVMYSQPLSEAEREWISQWVEQHVPKENLRDAFSHMMQEVLKIRKGELAHGFHPCPVCGSLCEADRKICRPCERKMERSRQNQVTLLLKEHPHWTYQEIRTLYPCDYSLYQKAREILIHRYKENIFHQYGVDEEKRKLLALLLHKPVETITKEEANEMLKKMPQKWWK